MPLKTSRDEPPAMNLTPMIDVVFNLLVFFMVGTKFIEMERAVGLKVPAVSQSAETAAVTKSRIVNVYQDGAIMIDQQTVSLEQLTQSLASARRENKDLGVLIRGDAASSFQRVAEVLNACKQAGIAELGISVRIATRER